MAGWEVAVTVFRDGTDPYTLRVQRLPVTLGASVMSDVVLDDPHVSGEHAWLTVSRGKLVFHDRSSNGSYLKGERIRERLLEAGDLVDVPPFRLQFALLMSPEERHTVQQSAAAPGPAAAGLEAEGGRGVSGRLAPDEPDRARAGGGAPAREPPPVEARVPERARTSSGFSLRVVKGPPELLGRILSVPAHPWLLGRGEGNDVRFNLPTVSRAHASFAPVPGGGLEVRDLKSSHGTFVNGRRVEEALLSPGDLVSLGRDVALVFTGEESAPASPRGGASTPTDQPPSATLTRVSDLAVRVRPGGHAAVRVVNLEGRCDGYTYPLLRDALDREVERGTRAFVVDLSEVTFVDHAGLGVLVKLVATLDALGGDLRLVGMTARLRDAFSLTRLDSIFRGRVASDEAAALRELGLRLPPGSPGDSA